MSASKKNLCVLCVEGEKRLRGGSGRNAASPESALKTPGGSWLDRRDAWRDMGRSEEQIAAEEARLEAAAAAARDFVKGAGTGFLRSPRRRGRIRLRTWGRSDELTCRMKARLAPLAGYFLRSLKNEFVKPSWAFRPAGDPMTPRRLYELACGGARGIFGAADRATRWRDFSRVVEWVKNTLKGWRMRGEWDARKCDAALAWLDSGAEKNGFTDTCARESFYESKKLFYTNTGSAGRSTQPLHRSGASVPLPLAGEELLFPVPEGDSEKSASPSSKGLRSPRGAGAEAREREADALAKAAGRRFSQGGAEQGGVCGRAERHEARQASGIERQAKCFGFASAEQNRGNCSEPEARSSEPEKRVPRFTGKAFPRRLWWLVWKWYGAFKDLHYGKMVAWSGACFISWFKSCLAAGKRCGDLYDLYADKLLRWHGLASDWRIGQDALHPRGLFAELYRAAVALPAFVPAPKAGTENFLTEN